jgi:putative addiction module component (TIGR02574 family)
MSAIEELEQTVLALPVEQRAVLAESLLDSLPPAGEVWSEAEELAEVERREREIENGQIQPLAAADFWQRIEARRKR